MSLALYPSRVRSSDLLGGIPIAARSLPFPPGRLICRECVQTPFSFHLTSACVHFCSSWEGRMPSGATKSNTMPSMTGFPALPSNSQLSAVVSTREQKCSEQMRNCDAKSLDRVMGSSLWTLMSNCVDGLHLLPPNYRLPDVNPSELLVVYCPIAACPPVTP